MSRNMIVGALAGLAFFFGISGPAYAAMMVNSAGVILTTDDATGNLVSAWGIEVNGQTLDVTFEDGSCISVFSGCDEQSDFFFGGDALGAEAASLALLSSVILDTPPLGNFDTSPDQTFGCFSPLACAHVTPWFHFSGFYEYWTFNNFSTPVSDEVVAFGGLKTDIDTTITFAVWSNTPSTIPEPPAQFIFLVGLIGLVRLSRRKHTGA